MSGTDHASCNLFRRSAGFSARLRSGGNAERWVRTLARDSADAVLNTLTRGVLVGDGPQVMTRMVRDAVSAPEARVATFVRTEVIGAARAGALDAYRANRDTVTGWVWNAAEDACAVCWSMNGTLHPLDEDMDSHPNCRCSPDPTTAPFDDLAAGTVPDDGSQGITPTNPNEALRTLPVALQTRILGPTRYAAFRDGALDVRDIATRTTHPVWGPGLRARSLRELGLR